jgi:hypothetical protein
MWNCMVYQIPFVDHTLRILNQLNWVVLIYYFSLLLKPTAQKMKLDWNSSTMSFRLTLPQLLSYE